MQPQDLPQDSSAHDPSAALPPRYSWLRAGLHWGAALLIVAQINLGLAMGRTPQGPWRDALFGWHWAVGLVVLGLTLWRVWLAWRSPSHRMVASLPLPRWNLRLMQAVHAALYVVLLLMTATGLLSLITLGALPPGPDGSPPPAATPWPLALHEWLANALFVLLLLHLIGLLRYTRLHGWRSFWRMRVG
jgi:cytochrome b561